MRFFNTETPVYQWLSRYCTIILIGLMWLLMLLPVITAGASCTAMSRMMFNIREDKGVGIGLFFKTLWKELGSSTLLLVIAAAAAALIAVVSTLIRTESLIVMSIIFLVVLLWLFTFLYMFPLNAFFSNTIWGTVKNAFLMPFKYFKKTVAVLAITLLPLFVYFIIGGYIIYTVPVWIFILLPLMEYWKSYFYLKIFYDFVEPEKRIAFEKDREEEAENQ